MNHFRMLVGACLLVLCTQVAAQKNYQVKGKVMDNTDEALVATTVALLEVSDSSFVDFGLTSNQGNFKMNAPRDSQYILQVSYLGYRPYIETIRLTKDYILDTIRLQEAINDLESVLIEADCIPLRMRGDTLEFSSAAFNVEAHDDVEKLIEKLPRVELTADGNITINWQGSR